MNRFDILKLPEDHTPCYDPIIPIAKNEEKEAIIANYLSTSEGRTRLADSMMQPLRDRRNYSSLARRAFIVEPIPEGALPSFDRDGIVS
jgi:hypothetical protein